MKRDKKPSLDFLKQLRSKRIAVVHPNDADGEILLQQLQRIGCPAQAFWPPPKAMPEMDVVFCALQADSMPLDWLQHCESAVVIAVISYESPTVFEQMIQMGASGVLTAPLRSSGVLAQLVMSLGLEAQLHSLHKRVARLEQKLTSVNQINDAKAILVRTRGVSSAEAYKIIRDQAMGKRVAAEEIARAIIHANDILSA